MRRGRRPVDPLFTGPIPDNPDYRQLVEQILRDKRKRDMLEAYRNGAVLVLPGDDGRETHRESPCVAMSE